MKTSSSYFLLIVIISVLLHLPQCRLDSLINRSRYLKDPASICQLKKIQIFENLARQGVKAMPVGELTKIIRDDDSLENCSDLFFHVIKEFSIGILENQQQQLIGQQILTKKDLNNIMLPIIQRAFNANPAIRKKYLDYFKKLNQQINISLLNQQLTYQDISIILNIFNDIKNPRVRLLQAQILNQQNTNGSVTTTTLNTVTQTTKSPNNTVSESTNIIDNTTNQQNIASFNFNTVKVPTSSFDISQFGFSIPGLSGGTFTQTITSKQSVNHTRTTTLQTTNTTRTINGETQVTQQTTVNTVNNQSSSQNLTTYTNQKPELAPGFSIETNVTVNSREVFNKQFRGVEFYHEIPEDFLQGQIFMFRGRVSINVSPTISLPINAMFQNVITKQSFSCTQVLQPGQRQFKFPCLIELSGKFYFSMFTGQTGQASNKMKNIQTSINYKIPQNSKPSAVSGIAYKFQDNQLTFSWDSRQPITKISFVQQNAYKSFLFSNYKNQFKVSFKQFSEFKANEQTRMIVQEASSKSGSAYTQNSQFSSQSELKFIALQHQFAEEDKNLILNSVSWVFSKNSYLVVSGRATVPIINKLLILTPDRQFLNPRLIQNGPDSISPGIKFQVSYKLAEQGNCIIEINDAENKAVLNRPLYVYIPNNYGPSIPLIPDFESLKKKVSNVNQILIQQPKTTSQKQKLMLDLINQKRKEFGIIQIVLDQTLSTVASNYANDMVRRGFTGHINPQGQNPMQRAMKLGIRTSIGQNLALNPNITDAHYRLSRSTIHLQNIVRKQWMKVGLGFAQYPSGSYRIVQVFSGGDNSDNSPEDTQAIQIGDDQLQKIRSQIIGDIINRHSNIKQENKILSLISKHWQKSSRTSSIASVLSLNGFNSYAYSSYKTTYSDNMIQKIIDKNIFQDSTGKKTTVGASITLLDNKIVEIYVIFI